MSKFFKHSVVTAVAMASGFFALNANAGNTIQFLGKVNSQTCSVKVDGTDSPNIMLPDVSIGTMRTAAVDTPIATKDFNIDLSGCTADTQADKTYHMKFVSNKYRTDGDLINEGTANGIALRLMDDNGTAFNFSKDQGIVVGGDIVLVKNATTATGTYTVGYVKKDPTALSAGSVSGYVSYEVEYN